MIDLKRHNIFARSRNLLVLASLTTLVACAGPSDSNDEKLADDTTTEQITSTPTADAPVDANTAEYDVAAVGDTDRNTILSKYSYLDPNHVVPTKALADAVVYYEANKAKFANRNYISIINFAQSSKTARFYIVDLNSGGVWPIHVAHGKGSDADHDGYAEKFSNVSGSNASSLGFYKTAETYSGNHGLSLKLDGLSSTNSNVRARAIVIHGASYVQEKSVIQGRSWGCPAVDMAIRTKVVTALKGGSLIYAVVDKGGTGPIYTGGGTTTPPTPTTPTTPTDPNQGTYEMSALAWNTSAHPERAEWSQYLMKLVLNDYPSLLDGASDMATFCPTYSSLNNNQRANVWAQIFVGMARYESGYDPTSRYQESTMGTDPITKKPVYSEGLMQLSYQDIQGYTFCKFDWSKDKYLSSTDPNKTILDPYINLQCGVGIMARQIKNKGKLTVGSGAYWAVLKSNNSGNKISSIASMVKSLEICK
jgi:hypothetical protein